MPEVSAFRGRPPPFPAPRRSGDFHRAAAGHVRQSAAAESDAADAEAEASDALVAA